MALHQITTGILLVIGNNRNVIAYYFRLNNGAYDGLYNYPIFTKSNCDYIYSKMFDIQTRQLSMEMGEEYPTNYIVSRFKFEDNYDVKVDLYNGTTENILKRSYSVSDWTLGWVNDWGSYDYYQFDLIDNRYDYEAPLYTIKVDSNLNTVGYSKGITVTNTNIYITSRLLDYNIPYRLEISLFYGDEVDTKFTYYYRFLPVNAIIGLSSGDSGDGYILSVGSGEFNTQDSTNAILDSSEVDDIINEYFSGDIEDLAEDFGFTTLDNPFTTFLFHILESTYDALTLREPVVLTASYNGMSFILNSNDFITPDSPLKTFIRALLIFLYIYGNYKYFHYLITLVETAKIDKVINEIGTDEFNDSNIM